MLEIDRYKNGHDYDCFRIKNETGILDISFEGVLDIFWQYIPKEENSIPKMSITKENIILYEEIDKVYNAIKNNKPYWNNNFDASLKNEKFPERERIDLFQNNEVKWYSDDYPIEVSSSVTIRKYKDNYELEFEKNKEGLFQSYTIRFRTSGSRYGFYFAPFINMYRNLKDRVSEYHQIHIDEYLYEKKLLKKRRR